MAEASEHLTHPVLGTLGWLPEFSHWFAQLPRPSGGRLDVIVDPGDGDRHEFIEPAAGLFRRALKAEPRLRRQAIRAELLDLYNDTWRQAAEPVLSDGELASRLELTLVDVGTVVPVTLHYEAGELFGGHGVAVELDERLRFDGLDLRG